MKTLLLAGSFQEASRYAAGKGLRSWRFASTAEDAASYRPERIVRLPGSTNRPTNHAIESLVRRLVRQNPRIEVVEDSYTPPPVPVPQYGDADYRADPLFGDVQEVQLGFPIPKGVTVRPWTPEEKEILDAMPPSPLDFSGAQEQVEATPEENAAAAVSATKRARKRSPKPQVTSTPTDLDDLFETSN